MNRANRGALILTVAGILLLLALVAYLISNAEDELQRREASFQRRELLRVQIERSTADRKALRAECDRMSKDRAELHRQHDVIIKSLQRIEKVLETTAPQEASH